MGKSGGKWAAGAVAAGVAGYLAGILTAPKSGKETREDIRRTALKAKTEAEKKLKEAHSELIQLLDSAQDLRAGLTGKAKEEVEAAIDGAKQAREKSRELLSALHDGDAEDPDLQAALKQAQKSITHLKSFLKK